MLVHIHMRRLRGSALPFDIAMTSDARASYDRLSAQDQLAVRERLEAISEVCGLMRTNDWALRTQELGELTLEVNELQLRYAVEPDQARLTLVALVAKRLTG